MGLARLRKREIELLPEMALLDGARLILLKVPGVVAVKEAVQVM